MVCAFMVFRIWYPPPFDELAGGLGLFVLVIGVDVVLGPALTAVVAAPGKRIVELKRDLAVIVVIQLAGLSYGIWTIAQARPVLLSWEIDRFRVVTAADVERSSLNAAPLPLRTLSWAGPRTIAAVKPTDPQELLRSVDLGLAGIDLSMVPSNWRDFKSEAAAAWQAARPAAALVARYPTLSGELERIASDSKLTAGELRFVPVISRQASWVALLALPNAQVVGYLPVDGFF